jgi:hypothetical protein
MRAVMTFCFAMIQFNSICIRSRQRAGSTAARRFGHAFGMNEAEAIGEAVTGGLAARPVEPAAGEQEGEAGGACLNCGSALLGSHCHRCGQAAHVHRTIAAWWHDLAHGVLHLDGKIWRTLPLLAWRPGELTRRYIAGERAKFVSPLALFLFSVFLMFAVVSAAGGGVGPDPTGVQRGLDEEMRVLQTEVGKLEKERAAAIAAKQPTAALDTRIERAREDLGLTRTMKEKGLVRGTSVRLSSKAPGWIARAVEKASSNPSLMLYKLQSNGYKFSWALIPLSLPFLWLLFVHRRRYRQYKAYDHLVFVTYSIAFMSLALTVVILLRQLGLGSGLLGVIAFLVPPVHIYRQLRGAYCLSRFSALWRTALLLFFATLALCLFLLLLAASIAH